MVEVLTITCVSMVLYLTSPLYVHISMAAELKKNDVMFGKDFIKTLCTTLQVRVILDHYLTLGKVW